MEGKEGPRDAPSQQFLQSEVESTRNSSSSVPFKVKYEPIGALTEIMYPQQSRGRREEYTLAHSPSSKSESHPSQNKSRSKNGENSKFCLKILF